MEAAGDEFMMEILSWVPVKSLLRLSCVCKVWKSLISDPHFMKLHLERSPKNANLIVSLISTSTRDRYLMSCSKASFLQNPFLATRHGILYDDNVIGSCNGLVCCLRRSSTVEDYYCFGFWNPERKLTSRYSPYLYRERTPGHPSFAFGYDKSSDTYKVVALLNINVMTENIESSKPTKVKVHTMGELHWRDIQTFPAFPIGSQNKGFFFNGTLNWLATKSSLVKTSMFKRFVISFKEVIIVSLDLGKETYKQFPLPIDFDHEMGGPPHPGKFWDCLCLFVDYKVTHLGVWQMKEFGVEKSWTRIFNISYQHLGGIGFVQFHSLIPLCTSENGDVLVFVSRCLNNCFEIILYNWINNTVEISNYGNTELQIDAKDHIQSLILPR